MQRTPAARSAGPTGGSKAASEPETSCPLSRKSTASEPMPVPETPIRCTCIAFVLLQSSAHAELSARVGAAVRRLLFLVVLGQHALNARRRGVHDGARLRVVRAGRDRPHRADG